MTNLQKILALSFRKIWPLIFIGFFVFVFFWKVFFQKLVPLPADLITGAYYPWLDYIWPGFPAGVPVKNPITSDVVSVIYPLRMYAIDLIKKGELPLWNPLMFGGYPLLANFQVAIFSPTIFYYIFLPQISAWSLQVISQPFLSALFAYLLFRHFKVSQFASVVGGIFFAFSGFNIIWLEWNAHSLSASFIALLIMLADKFFFSRKIYLGVLFSVVVCLQIFSGYPQIFLYSMLSIFILCFFRLKRAGISGIILILLFATLGLLLSAIQTFPAIELLVNSQRAEEVLSVDLQFLPWQNLIAFLAPDYFGNHTTGNFWGKGNYTNNALYSGATTFILALIAIKKLKRRKKVCYFLFIFLISLFLTLPSFAAKFIQSIPIFGITASSSTRILVLANLSLSALAAIGIDYLLSKKHLPRWEILAPLGFLLALALFSIVNRYTVGFRNLILPIFIVAFLGVLLYLLRAFFIQINLRKLFVFFICMVGILELLRFGWKYTTFSREDFIFPKTKVISFLQNAAPPFRIASFGVIPMNMWLPFGLESFSGYDAIYPYTIAKYISVINSQNHISSPMGRYGSVDKYFGNLFNLTNTRYLLVLKKEYEEGRFPNYQKVFEEKSVVILENKEFLPRAFFVSECTLAKEEDILAKILDKNFNPTKMIVLSQGEHLDCPEISYPGSVRLVHGSSIKSKIEVDATGKGFLFLADTYYPGWEVYVDSRKTQILRANYAFRAVFLDSGKHIVEFIYSPESVKIGVVVSVTTFFLLTGLVIYEKVIGKRSSSVAQESSSGLVP